MTVSTDPLLGSLDLSNVVGPANAVFIAESDAALTTIDLRRATSASSVVFRSDTSLSTVRMDALAYVDNAFKFTGSSQVSQCALLAKALAFRTHKPDLDFTNTKAGTCATSSICTPVTIAGITDAINVCTAQSFATDRAVCQSLGNGTDLLWAESQAEWTAVQAAIAGGTLTNDSYVGYSDAAVEGTWKAVSGVPGFDLAVNQTNFATGEPNGGSNENVAEMESNGRANDNNGLGAAYALCRTP